MRIAMAQLNPTIGDFGGNFQKAERAVAAVRDQHPDLVVFPELFVTGYPPQDLLEKQWFVARAQDMLASYRQLSRRHPECGILVGTISAGGQQTGKGLYNTAVLLAGGEIQGSVHKVLLPTYDVFDEARYFDSGRDTGVMPFRGERLGVSICEDAWSDPKLWSRRVYDVDPIARQTAAGATILVNVSASPFTMGKDGIRYRLAADHARRHGRPFLLVNQVGGNDELVFDGHSLCAIPSGKLAAYLPGFREEIRVVDSASGPGSDFTPEEPTVSVYEALVLGLRDYVHKCGFAQVAVGLSGGIDSAVVCAIAVAALGPDRVLGVTMPSPYSSAGSVVDSRTLAANLGVRLETVPITGIYEAYLRGLEPHLDPGEIGVPHQNIQARIRGNVLMALSNQLGCLVLSTGNKSELAVGYCTLYGDMSGGLAVISDVPKTMVYELAHHINREREIIPRAIFLKAPSAELLPDQTDQDTLPPYEILDRILKGIVDEGRSAESLIADGYEEAMVRWVVRAVHGNEYKRRQAAPGLKVTSKAFGSGRRMPIAARYETAPTSRRQA